MRDGNQLPRQCSCLSGASPELVKQQKHMLNYLALTNVKKPSEEPLNYSQKQMGLEGLETDFKLEN